MGKQLKKYYQVWLLTATNALQEAFVNRGTNSLFFLGKVIRFAMSLVLLFLIKQNIKTFAGYTPDQMVIIFLTYQFVDVLVQVFYRGVYMFTYQIRHGELDFLLLKPINPLFQALTGVPDINDALFIIPTTIISLYIASQLSVTISLATFGAYLLLLLNSFLIATALHIAVLAGAIVTTDVDGLIWLYRDLMRLGQYPVTIYLEPLRFLLFFLVPVGVMITIPAQVLLSLPLSYGIGIALCIGLLSIIVSLRLWHWSLKHYTSASS